MRELTDNVPINDAIAQEVLFMRELTDNVPLADEIDIKKITNVARTQGFWSTHKELLILKWSDVRSPIVLGPHTLTDGTSAFDESPGPDTDIPEVLGGFWAKVGRESDNSIKRTPAEQAHIQLLQQLLAALLNEATFGTPYIGTLSDSSTGDMIGDAITNWNTLTQQQALDLAEQIEEINEFGSMFDLPPEIDAIKGKAIPGLARQMADTILWDDVVI